MASADYEITQDLNPDEDVAHDEEMAVEEASLQVKSLVKFSNELLDDRQLQRSSANNLEETNRLKSAASKRKGRGFAANKGISILNKNLTLLNMESLMLFNTLTEKLRNVILAKAAVEGWIVLVTNVHEETTEEDMIDLMQEYGILKNLHLNLDRRTGYVKGYALAEYREQSEAKNAIKHLNGHVMQGKKLSCDFAFVRGALDRKK